MGKFLWRRKQSRLSPSEITTHIDVRVEGNGGRWKLFTVPVARLVDGFNDKKYAHAPPRTAA